MLDGEVTAPRSTPLPPPSPPASAPPRPSSPGGAPASGPSQQRAPGDPSIRRTWWLLAGAFFLLALTSGVRLVTEKQPIDWLIAALVVVAAVAAVVAIQAAAATTPTRRSGVC